eukprot:Nk52_evm31s2506 gene=Nk52_evmTU31s2506
MVPGSAEQDPGTGREGEQEGGEGVMNPLVFQCSCRSVVGDSFSWLCAKESLNTISLTAIPVHTGTVEVQRDKLQAVLQQGAPDCGATYNPIKCATCGKLLGRVYRTTARDLDDIRDAYTFDLNAISSYQLGVEIEGQKGDLVKPETLLSLPTAAVLQEGMIKVQNMILLLNERLEQVEAQERVMKERWEAIKKQQEKEITKRASGNREKKEETAEEEEEGEEGKDNEEELRGGGGKKRSISLDQGTVDGAVKKARPVKKNKKRKLMTKASSGKGDDGVNSTAQNTTTGGDGYRLLQKQPKKVRPSAENYI